MSLKSKSLYFFVDNYLGKDSNKISIFDRIVGVVKRQRKKTSFIEDLKAESLREISFMEEFSLSIEELDFALSAAILYTGE